MKLSAEDVCNIALDEYMKACVRFAARIAAKEGNGADEFKIDGEYLVLWEFVLTDRLKAQGIWLREGALEHAVPEEVCEEARTAIRRERAMMELL